MKKKSSIIKRLLDSKLIDEEAVNLIQEEAKNNNRQILEQINYSNIVSSKHLLQITAEEFGIPALDLDVFDTELIPQNILTDQMIFKYQVAPLVKKNNKIFFATCKPNDDNALEAIKFNTGLRPEPILVEEIKLLSILDKITDHEELMSESDESSQLDQLDQIEIATESNQKVEEDNEYLLDDAPVIRFVNKILLNAIRNNVSDLHFEPYEKMYRIRFRTDGILSEAAKPPVSLSNRITARIKIMSGLDISERRRPQDGRIKLKISKNKSIDFRVNTLPTLWGEKVVLRILDSSSAMFGVDALGYEEDQKKLYLEALKKPQGMILVTGPTGSGKTVSLYTGLNILNTSELNISTVEDPVEINLEGINQVNVNVKQGLLFSDALKSFLRQDPDVIMVGEIRDLETANIAIKAAQTGHLVLSTLHTNSASETLTRLLNMSIPSFNLATSISLIIAQRLARRLCNVCKIELDLPLETLLAEGFSEEELNKKILYTAKGCRQCNKGYKGRVGIYEVVKATPSIQKIIMAEGNSLEISEIARKEGFPSLRRSGLVKVLQGITSLREVNRVTTD